MMTPKEKAIVLSHEVFDMIGSGYSGYRQTAKDIVVYMVDEIIKVAMEDSSKNGGMVDEGYAVDYWNEVKKEALKLYPSD